MAFGLRVLEKDVHELVLAQNAIMVLVNLR
jgi:hypothetical protein